MLVSMPPIEVMKRPSGLQERVAPLLEVLKKVKEQVAELDEALEHLCQQDAPLQRLCTVPYVGPVTACTFASVVDRAERFGSAHQVEAYLGLDWLLVEVRRAVVTRSGGSRFWEIASNLGGRTVTGQHSSGLTAGRFLLEDGLADDGQHV